MVFGEVFSSVKSFVNPGNIFNSSNLLDPLGISNVTNTFLPPEY